MDNYQITADRSAVARYSGTVELAKGTDLSLVQPYGAQIRVRSGFMFADGSEELADIATMRIDDVAVTQSGKVVLGCFGLEKALADAQFRQPMVLGGPGGVSTIGAIRQLLSIVDAPVSVVTRRDAALNLVVYATDRWKAIDGDDKSLARSLGVEVFADAAGTFIIQDIPTLATNQVSWTVNAGPSGVLVGFRQSMSRAGVYNVVVASSNQSGTPGVVATSVDLQSSSPTYVYGPFGEVVRQYQSPLLNNVTQAQLAADTLRANSQGLTRTLTFTAKPNPASEPGDVVVVAFPDGTKQLHLLDRVTHGSSGAQTADTRTTQAAVTGA